MTEFLFIVMLILLLSLMIYSYLILGDRSKNKELSWLKGYFCHRGYYDNQNLPENSLPAFRSSMENQFGIELDVQLSADGHVIVFHDDDLKRMTGQDKAMKDCSLQELKKYNLINTDAKIPTLEEVLELVDGKVPLYIEIKDFSMNFQSLVDKTLSIVSDYSGPFAVCSFNPLVLIHIKKKAPHIIRGIVSQNFRNEPGVPGWQKVILQNMLLNFMAKPHFISYGYNDINLSLRLCRWLGCMTAGWAIGSEEEQLRYQKYYDMIVFEHYNPHKISS